MTNLLEQIGGSKLINRTVSEFYQAVGKHMTSFEACDHRKQEIRQAQFLNHAFSAQPEPVHTDRASFLARGLNPVLFEALLEYIEARLPELGHSHHISRHLVQTAGSLYDNCDQPLAIAC